MTARKDEEWRRAILSTIGGSSAAAAAGRSAWLSRRELWRRMVAARSGDPLPPDEQSDDMRRGRLLEPVAAEVLAEAVGRPVQRHPQDQFVQNPALPWAHVLPDAWIDDGAARLPVELKVPRPAGFARLTLGQIPDQWSLQVVHLLAVTDASAALFVALNPVTMELFTLRVERRDVLEAEAELMAAERSLWRHVLDQTPPTDCSTETPDLSEPVDAEAEGRKRELPLVDSPEIVHAMRTWLRLRDVADEARALMDELRERMRAEARLDAFRVPVGYLDARGVTYDEAVVHDIQQQGRKTLDTKAALAAFPQLSDDRYWKIGQPFRTWRVYPRTAAVT